MNAERIGSTDDTPRGFDRVSAILTVVILASLAGAGWLRYGRKNPAEPPGVGRQTPPLRLMDAETGEPLLLLGLRGKVVWITFWSAATPEAPADLQALSSVWKRLQPHTKYAMAVAAAEADRKDHVRSLLAACKTKLPAYLATPETLSAFGANQGELPLHVLLDPSGKVIAVARGRDPATLKRLADQAERMLDEIEPMGQGRSRFARSRARHPVHEALQPVRIAQGRAMAEDDDLGA